LHDLVSTLKELTELGVAFVSLTEAVDLSTAIGRAMAGLLSVFAEFELEMLSERVKAGIAQAKKRGQKHGRPKTASLQAAKVHRLFAQGHKKAEIARKLGIGRTSELRIVVNHFAPESGPRSPGKRSGLSIDELSQSDYARRRILFRVKLIDPACADDRDF